MTVDDLKKDVDLLPYTTLRLKATAKYFFEARSREDLIKSSSLARDENLRLIVLGGGSNVAFSKKEFPGIVVRNLYMKREVISQDEEGAEVLVSSGYPVAKLVNENNEDGFAGLEYHLGLPGVVGGAIYMNSKWTHPTCYFGDPLVAANLIEPDGTLKTVDRGYFQFAYDYSTLHKTKEILLEAVFKYKKASPDVLKKRSAAALKYRKSTQPHGVKSVGCIFQNITPEEMRSIHEKTQSAGNLIDRAGFKGYMVGNFYVSPEHANFILNEGEGNPEDLMKLIAAIKKKVAQEFGVDLKEEVVIIN